MRTWSFRVVGALALGAVLLSPHLHAQIAPAATATVSSETLDALYGKGLPYDAFVAAGGERRKQTWFDNHAAAEVPPAFVERLNAASGDWRLLAVAEVWCADSANSVPYLSRLADASRTLHLRVVDSTVGRTVLETHRTPDGRAATPVVLVLDAMGHEVGALVERPGAIQSVYMQKHTTVTSDAMRDEIFAWYDRDRGQTAMRTIVEIVEQAARSGR